MSLNNNPSIQTPGSLKAAGVIAGIKHSMSIRLPTKRVLTLAMFVLLPISTFCAARSECYWGTGTGPILYTVNVGALYVPRDAQIGDPIGPTEQPFAVSGGTSSIHCINDITGRLSFTATITAPRVSGAIERKSSMTIPGTLLQTNISGVGALLSFGSPYNGLTNGFWKLNGPDSSVPFSAYIDFVTPFAIQHGPLRGNITLIKTGDIDPGQHSLNSARELVKGSFSGVPDAFGVALSGSVTRAECTLSANPVSADPVQLGEWPMSHFTGEGQTTDSVPFSIALNSCISDPLPGGTVTNAHIRLDPTAGSTTLDASQGLLSLGTSSTARGIGIQILARDGTTPIALEAEVPQGAIPVTGGMMLELNARYYQTGPTSAVEAGSADGALGFTITYK